MNIGEARNQIGLSQRELANWLGMDRTQLNRSEKGHRYLPQRVARQWSRIRDCVDDATELEEEAASIAAEQQQRVRVYITEQLEACSASILSVQCRLARMKEQYKRCMTTLAFVRECRKKLELREEDDMHLKMLESRAMKQSWDWGPEKQLILYLRLQSLRSMEHELTLLNNRIF